MRALLNWRSTNGWFPQISECWTDQYMGMAKTFVGFGEVIVDTTQKPIRKYSLPVKETPVQCSLRFLLTELMRTLNQMRLHLCADAGA